MHKHNGGGDVMAALLGSPVTTVARAPEPEPEPAEMDTLPSRGRATSTKRTKSAKDADAKGRKRTTTYLDRKIEQQIADAANHLAGHPTYLTMADIIENGARAELRRLWREYNNGQPFEATGRRPRPGRRGH